MSTTTDDAWHRLAGRVASELTGWAPAPGEQQDLRREGLNLLECARGSAVRKAAGPEHVTASAFVLSPAHDAVLLTLHRKAGRWLQLGGHIEGTDPDAAGAAQREAAEEGGIAGITLLSAEPMDLERQQLRGSFGGCAVHWDLGFLAQAAGAQEPSVSAESEDVRWWPLAEVRRADAAVAARLMRVLEAWSARSGSVSP